jgi:hypothetical protein
MATTVTPPTIPKSYTRRTIAETIAINGEITTSAQILKTRPVAIPTNALATIRTTAIVNFNSGESAIFFNQRAKLGLFPGADKTALLTFGEQ